MPGSPDSSRRRGPSNDRTTRAARQIANRGRAGPVTTRGSDRWNVEAGPGSAGHGERAVVPQAGGRRGTGWQPPRLLVKSFTIAAPIRPAAGGAAPREGSGSGCPRPVAVESRPRSRECQRRHRVVFGLMPDSRVHLLCYASRRSSAASHIRTASPSSLVRTARLVQSPPSCPLPCRAAWRDR